MEALRGILRAFLWQLISVLQPCKAKMAPKRHRKAKKLLNIAICFILGALGGCLGPILEGLGGVLEALGRVSELLEGSWKFLKASLSRPSSS